MIGVHQVVVARPMAAGALLSKNIIVTSAIYLLTRFVVTD